MTLMLNRFGMPRIVFNAEGGAGGSGGGDGGAAAAASATPESVLFPNEGGDGTGDNSGQGAENKGGEGGDQSSAGDWKEYVNDPNKSDADNAAAKAEHDKTKPADKAGDDLANKVPEDGKYTLTMPDGVELDGELADALGPEFKELGLTNAQANKLVGKYIETMQKRTEAHASSPEGAWSSAAHQYFKENGTPDKWADTAKADKDIGGDKWNTTVENATRFTNAFGTPALKDFLNKSGGGNHPELIRVFAKAGELIREDNPATGGAGGASKPADPAHLLFPNDAPKG